MILALIAIALSAFSIGMTVGKWLTEWSYEKRYDSDSESCNRDEKI